MMKNKTIILFAAIALILIVACNTETKYETRQVDDMFSIDIPTYMTDINLENPEASITVGDSLKERYVMVIYETKQEIEEYGVDMELDINNYSEIVIEMFGQAFTNPETKKVTQEPKPINGITSLSYEIRGEFAEVGAGIYSYITILESDKSFYTIYIWSLETDERNFTPEAHHIAVSFKEL
jgi:hypothetical protein